MHMYVYMYGYMCIIHTYIYTHNVYTHTYIYTHKFYVLIDKHTSIHELLFSLSLSHRQTQTRTQNMHTNTYTNMKTLNYPSALTNAHASNNTPIHTFTHQTYTQYLQV